MELETDCQKISKEMAHGTIENVNAIPFNTGSITGISDGQGVWNQSMALSTQKIDFANGRFAAMEDRLDELEPSLGKQQRKSGKNALL